MTEHGFDSFAARACLCISELTANAVLHTARPFTVSVQGSSGRVRIEVVDSAPHLTPVRVPVRGTAADLTALSETGRGLQIVSAIANRWGVTLAQNVKAVWCEFYGDEPAAPTEPVVDDERPATPKAPNVHRFEFLGLPVRAAIASGINVEEAILDVQSEDARLTSPETRELLALVDRTASLRLAGRHAALDASARNEVEFDLEVETTSEEMAATARLNEALAARGAHRPSDEVTRFRRWIVEETGRQRDGKPPSRYGESGPP
ncbi:MAG TPA: ATP-binding protein [Acidimicrobiales bacterium]|nr:ATP-binding protein [Acidimicrobiales bacterium]